MEKKITNYQTDQSHGLLLNANESPDNINKEILDEIKSALEHVDFNRYPEDSSSKLINAYSKYIGVDPECIIAGNGSDEMLGLLLGLNMEPGKKLYTITPDFSMYDYYTSMHRGDIIRYDNGADKDFNVDDFIKMGIDEEVDMILFSNPNNPTGKLISREDIRKILETFRDILVVVDEAYVEFCDGSMVKELNNYANLIITRTLSKAFGVASIRCGFLLTNPRMAASIRTYKVPYNVNTLTQTVGTIVLEHSDLMIRKVDEIRYNRDLLYKNLIELELDRFKFYPSNSNYIFGITSIKDEMLKEFEKANIVIRNYEGPQFRITIGNKSDNERVLEVFKRLGRS